MAADPLEALRYALSQGSQTISYLARDGGAAQDLAAAHTLVLPTSPGAEPIQVEKRTVTRLARDRANASQDPRTNPTAFHTLESLLLAVQLRDAPLPHYLRTATSSNLPFLSVIDRAPVIDYLTGKRDQWDGVAPLGGDVSAPVLGDVNEAVAPSATPPGSPSAALKARFGAVNGSVPGTAASTDASGAAPAAVPSLKRPYVVNKEDQEAVKRIRASEVTLRTRADALHGTNPLKTADFNTFRASFASRLEAARRVASGKAPAHSSVAASRSSTGVPVQGARRTRAQDPIIMISSSPTALVNMYNVKRLLEEGVFVPPEQARAEAAGHAEPVVQVMHQRVDVPPGAPPPRKVRYLIVDNTEALQRLGGGGVDAWDRVVAVFTTGQAWQFRSYPRSDPRDLFKHVQGVYVRWHNEEQNPNVRDWSVLDIQIDRTKRHTDKQVVALLWRTLESWISRRKPSLQI